ncbi:MAG: hypothetical protein ACLGHN_05775 [Bacteriovoracia bacterium]
MFKKTLNFSDLKSDPSAIAELKNDEVVQVFHRGHEVKVMMTQDHFFNLMARLEKFENSGKTSKYDVEDLLAEFDNKLKQVNAMLGKNKPMKRTGTN